METLVKMMGKRVYADSRVIADAFEIEHRILFKLIKSHQGELEAFGVLHFQSVKPLTGRPMKTALLSEEQALLLLTYTRARPATIKMRKKLIDDFVAMRNALVKISSNRDNQMWLAERDKGRLQRRSTTDIIKKFVEYAKSQGSQKADLYYMNLTKMENRYLFFIQQKFPNLRELMTGRQLNVVQTADLIVEEAIIYGMAQCLNYKDIYKLCKERIERFAGIVPRTIIPLTLEDRFNGSK